MADPSTRDIFLDLFDTDETKKKKKSTMASRNPGLYEAIQKEETRNKELEDIATGLRQALGGIYDEEYITDKALEFYKLDKLEEKNDSFDAVIKDAAPEIVVYGQRTPFWQTYNNKPEWQKKVIREDIQEIIRELPPTILGKRSRSEAIQEAMAIYAKRKKDAEQLQYLITYDEEGNPKRAKASTYFQDSTIKTAGVPGLTFKPTEVDESQSEEKAMSLERLHDKFQRFAQDMSDKELTRYEDLINQLYITNGIPEETYQDINTKLGKLNNPAYRYFDAEIVKDEKQFRDKEELSGAKLRLYNVFYNNKMRQLNDNPRINEELGISPLKQDQYTEKDINKLKSKYARQYAMRRIRPYRWFVTSEFYDSAKPTFVSNVVDREKGLIEDPETGEIRKGTDAELAIGAFKRQRISTPEQKDQDTAINIYRTNKLDSYKKYGFQVGVDDTPFYEQKEQPKEGSIVFDEYSLAQEVRRKRANKYREEGIYDDLSFVDGNLSLLAKKYPKAYETYKNINAEINIESLKEEKRNERTLINPLLQGRITGRQIKKGADWLSTSELSDGTTIESIFALTPRIFFNIPTAVVAAAASESLPGIDRTKLKSPKNVQIVQGSDQPIITPRKNVAAQAILNIAEFQSLPDVFRAYKPLTDLIGETPAYTVGIIPELFMPLTGVPTALRTAKGAGKLAAGVTEAVGKTNILLKPVELTGRAARTIVTPIESLKTRAMANVVEDVLEGGGKLAAKRLRYKWSVKDDWASIWDNELRRQTFARHASDMVGDKIATPYILNQLGVIKKSPADKYNMIVQMAHNNTYVDELLVKTSHLKTPTEKFAKMQEIIKGDVAKLNKVKKSPLYNQLFDTAKSQASIFGNQGKLLNEKATKEMLQEVHNANPDVIYEHFKVRLASLLEQGVIDDVQLAGIARRFAKLPENQRTQKKLQELLPEFDDAYIIGDLKGNISATSRSISKRMERGLADVAPLKMVMFGNDTGVRPVNLTKQAKQQYVEDWNKIIIKNTSLKEVEKDGSILYFYDVFKPEPILAELVKELGPKTIRTQFWLDTLKAIDKGEITIDQMQMIKNTIDDALAKKHFKGVQLTEFGEQATQARNPLKDNLFSSNTSLEKTKLDPDYTPSHAVQAVKGLARAVMTFKKGQYNVANPATTTRLKNTFDEINLNAPKIFDEFLETVEKDLKVKANEVFERTGVKPNQKELDVLRADALNKTFTDTWQTIANKRKENIAQIVERSFDGSYKAYANAVIRSTEKNVAGSPLTNIQQRFKDAKKRGEKIDEDWWRKEVMDSETYLDKVDVWRKLLDQYYRDNPAALKLLKSESQTASDTLYRLIKKLKIKETDTGMAEWKITESVASKTLDPNPTNFIKVIKRLEDNNKIFKKNQSKKSAVGLSTVPGVRNIPGVGKKNVMMPLMGWALSTKQSNNASEILKRYMDSNPNAVLELVQDPLVMRLPIEHGDAIAKQYMALLGKTGLSDEIKKDISQSMADAHINAVNRISAKDKIEALQGKMQAGFAERALGEDPNLANRLAQHTKQHLEVLKTVLRNKLAEADIAPEVLKQLEKDAVDNFIGINRAHDNLIESAFGGLIKRYENLLRRSGAVVDDYAKPGLADYRPIFKQLSSPTAALIYGSDFVKEINKLEEIVRSGKIDKYFDQSKGGVVLNSLDYLVDLTQRLEINGLLGGAPIPVFRNIGMNAITAPLMMMATTGTLGLKSALSAMGIYRKVPQVSKVMGMPADKVVFTTELGKQYTAGELRELLRRYNTGFSQEQILLSSRKADQMLEDMKVTVEGLRKNPKTRFLVRNFNPANRTPGVRLNIMIDQALRDQTFFMALASGKSPRESAILAKRSVYNYGQVDANVRKRLSRYLLFVSFQLENAKETANYLYRIASTDKPDALLGLLRANFAKQKEAETWLYTDDDSKLRAYLPFLGKKKEKHQGTEYYQAGPRIPQLETVKQLVNAFESIYAMQSMSSDNVSDDKFDEAVNKLITNVQYRPSLKFMLDMIQNSNPNKEGMKVPDEWIYWLRTTGKLQDGTFDDLIVPMEVSKRRFDQPTYEEERRSLDTDYFGSVQYRFRNNAAEQKYYKLMFIGTLLGQERLLKEASNMMMSAGFNKEAKPALTVGTGYKGQEMLNPFLYMLGITSKKEANKTLLQFQRKKMYYIKMLEQEADTYKSEEK